MAGPLRTHSERTYDNTSIDIGWRFEENPRQIESLRMKITLATERTGSWAFHARSAPQEGPGMRLSFKWIFVCSALALAAGPAWSAGSPPVLQSQDVAGAAAGVAAGAHLQVEGVQVADTGEAAAFDLERFEVFAKDARITVHGDAGDRVLRAPANAYFRGLLKGQAGSRVFLARPD